MAFRKKSKASALTEDAWGTCFLPAESRPTVKAMVKLLMKNPMDEKIIRKMTKVAVKLVEGDELSDEVRQGIKADEGLRMVFDGLYELIHEAVRLKTSLKVVAAELPTLGIPKSLCDDICKVLKNKIESLVAANTTTLSAAPSVVDVNWRVDVAISTTSLSRAFKPTVMMQLTLSDGQIKTFECSVEAFHSLRYNTAKALKSLVDLSQHPTILREI